MGWRVSGVVIVWITFSSAFQQPLLAVDLACLAGWLFGRGRELTVSSPQRAASEGVERLEGRSPR